MGDNIKTGNDMHTDTDKQIEALIADRATIEAEFPSCDVLGKAEAAKRITDINLRIMQLQGKQADAYGDQVRDQGLRNGSLVICKTCGSTFALAAGHACKGLAPKPGPAADIGITTKTVWTTKDGKTWDRLEDAIAHQRKGKIIDRIYDLDDNNIPWISDHAEQIAQNAAEIFDILEPFFRKGE